MERVNVETVDPERIARRLNYIFVFIHLSELSPSSTVSLYNAYILRRLKSLVMSVLATSKTSCNMACLNSMISSEEPHLQDFVTILVNWPSDLVRGGARIAKSG